MESLGILDLRFSNCRGWCSRLSSCTLDVNEILGEEIHHRENLLLEGSRVDWSIRDRRREYCGTRTRRGLARGGCWLCRLDSSRLGDSTAGTSCPNRGWVHVVTHVVMRVGIIGVVGRVDRELRILSRCYVDQQGTRMSDSLE